MNIKAKVYLVEESGPVKAMADICYNNSIVIKDVRIVQRNDRNELMVQMPQSKGIDGNIHSKVSVPVHADKFRNAVNKAVLDEYHNVLNGEHNRNNLFNLMEADNPEFVVKRSTRVNDETKAWVKAVVDIGVDNSFVIHDVLLCQGKTGQYYLKMPQKHDGVKFADRVYAVTSELQKKMTNIVQGELGAEIGEMRRIQKEMGTEFIFP